MDRYSLALPGLQTETDWSGNLGRFEWQRPAQEPI